MSDTLGIKLALGSAVVVAIALAICARYNTNLTGKCTGSGGVIMEYGMGSTVCEDPRTRAIIYKIR